MTDSEKSWKTPILRHPVVQDFVIAPLAMATIFRLAFAEFLAGDRSRSTLQDNTYLIHPLFSHISRSFSRGEYPYWIDTLVAGLPLYNTPQFSSTYPLYFFNSGLYATPLSAIMQIHYVTTLHLFILYLNTYILLREHRGQFHWQWLDGFLRHHCDIVVTSCQSLALAFGEIEGISRLAYANIISKMWYIPAPKPRRRKSHGIV